MGTIRMERTASTSDPTRIAVAAARAHELLAESHEPLVMTPGDVRALLARTQRRLRELADAVEPVSAVEDPDPDAAAARASATASDVTKREVAVWGRLAGEPEHLLGQDVALDLVRTAGDRLGGDR